MAKEGRSSDSSARGGIGRRRLAGAALLLVAVVAGVGLHLHMREEPGEDVPAPGMSFDEVSKIDPRARTLRRLSRLSRSPELQDGGVSHDRRNSMIIAELARSINDDFREFSRLPPEEKQAMARKLLDDALITQQYFHRFPMRKQGRAVSLFLKSPDCQKQFYRAVSIVGNDLSADDLRMLGPAIRIWASMIRGKQP